MSKPETADHFKVDRREPSQIQPPPLPSPRLNECCSSFTGARMVVREPEAIISFDKSFSPLLYYRYCGSASLRNLTYI